MPPKKKKTGRRRDPMLDEAYWDDGAPPPTREQVRELRRRMKEHDNPVRYIVVSEVIPGSRYFYYQVADNCYGIEIGQASLFKTQRVAEAVRGALDEGREVGRHLVVKITTKGGRRKALRYFRDRAPR